MNVSLLGQGPIREHVEAGLAALGIKPAPIWVGADILISACYRRIVSRRELDRHKVCVNVHPSPLPAYRGCNPINWMVLEGARYAGVTIHRMVEKVDAGDILLQSIWPIKPGTTAQRLMTRAAYEAEDLIQIAYHQLCDGTATWTPQDESKATYRGKRTPDMGRITDDMSVEQIDRLVRAVGKPWPGAFLERGGKRYIIWEGEPCES